MSVSLSYVSATRIGGRGSASTLVTSFISKFLANEPAFWLISASMSLTHRSCSFVLHPNGNYGVGEASFLKATRYRTQHKEI